MEIGFLHVSTIMAWFMLTDGLFSRDVVKTSLEDTYSAYCKKNTFKQLSLICVQIYFLINKRVVFMLLHQLSFIRQKCLSQ